MTLTLLLILSCHGKDDQEKKDCGDWVYFGIYDKLTEINPIEKAASVSSQISEVIFNGLVDTEESGEIVPDLAKGWEWSKDKKSLNFYLRDGVKFHDGSLLSARDVNYTLKTILNQPATGASRYIYDAIESIEVVDNLTISATLKENFRFLPFDRDIFILPFNSFEGSDENKKFSWNPVGTGPFTMKKLSESEAILEANRDYFKGRPFLDGIVVKSYQTQEEVWSRLLMEEIDFCLPLSPAQINFMKNNVNFKIYSFLEPYLFILVFNQEKPLFQSKKLRIALNYAINREKIVATVLDNNGRLCSGTIYPGSWAYDPEIKPYPYDPQYALKLLREEGWPERNKNGILTKNGKLLEFKVLTIKGNDLYNDLILLVEKDLAEIGIKINAKAVNMAEIDKYFFQKNFDAVLINISSGVHPGFWNFRFWHSSQIENGLNVFSYRNSEVDKDLELGLRAEDQKEAKGYFRKFQREIFDDPPGVFLFWRMDMVPIHKRFRGVKIGAAKFFGSIPEWWVPKNEQKYKNGPN